MKVKLDEEEFRQNIERQSTLTKHLRIVFVGEVTSEITDLKETVLKNRRKGSK